MNVADVTADDFIRELVKPAPANAYAWITTFKGDPAAVAPGWWKGRLHDPKKELRRINGENAYVSVAVFDAAAEGRKKKEPHHVVAIFADDVGTKADRNEVERVLGLPTAAMETSNGNPTYW